MIVVGITGVLGSGKSTVARFISEFGYQIIDLDAIAHSLLDLEEVRGQIVKAFGKDILQEGNVDRKKLAEKVFNDEKSLRKLEEILHPKVIKEMQKRIDELKAKGEEIVFVDGPLIFEAGVEKMFDRIVVVYSDENQIIERMRKRGMEEEEVKARLKNQLPIQDKLRRAHHVIFNTGGKENLKSEVERFIKKVKEWEVNLNAS